MNSLKQPTSHSAKNVAPQQANLRQAIRHSKQLDASHRARQPQSLKPLRAASQDIAKPSVQAGQQHTAASALHQTAAQQRHTVEVHTPVPQQAFCHQQEIARLQQLLQLLQTAGSLPAQVQQLWSYPLVDDELNSSSHMLEVARCIGGLPEEDQFVLLSAVAAGQGHLCKLPATAGSTADALSHLAACLHRVQQFYDSMGGLVGYQLRSLQLIAAGLAEAGPQPAPGDAHPLSGFHQHQQQQQQQQQQVTEAGASGESVVYHVPKGLDLAGEAGPAPGQAAAAAGLLALPETAEIYPVGGAGDRLGLQCDITGECLPAAVLPYCGRPLLQNLLRDLQAREHLYFRLTGQQVRTPVAVMTSDAKGNHRRILQLLRDNDWFGRGEESFKLFRQPLVPVLAAEDGKWLLEGPFTPATKPGGHGAIWKLMHDEGVFQWLMQQGRRAGLVRQISNPIAGTDTTLLALAGEGVARGAAMGFMSCERAVGAAEGMNVLQERRVWVDGPDGGRWEYQYGVTNVEYTEFERLGISDEATGEGSQRSVFPANTNILYVGLPRVRAAVEAAVASGGDAVMPGLIFNLKKKVAYTDPLTGAQRQLTAGRMETTMQNLADSLTDAFPAPLPLSAPSAAPLPPLSTFLVQNLRRKVTSSAKKKLAPGSRKIAQTPDGSFYDLMRNAWQLLQMCGFQHVPEIGSVDSYLEAGPSFIFLYHPALGPLWDVIAQKVRGGRLGEGSELVLEVAEARLVNLQLQGSLLVSATQPLGHIQGGSGQAGLVDSAAGGLHTRSFSFQMASGDGGAAGAELVVHGLPVGGVNGGARGAAAAGGAAAGAAPGGKLVYSDGCGRVNLENVRVVNAGIDWQAPGTVFWKHQVHRQEALSIVLHGRSEFDARDVTLSGSWTFHVPDGFRMVVTTAPAGGIQKWLFPLDSQQPSWWWQYSLTADGAVRLQYQKSFGQDLFPTTAQGEDEERFVLDWVI